MYSPLLRLQPISTPQYWVSGTVTIHEAAVIAPGVLLQADPDSQIVIRSGACIGVGTILHARQGLLEIGEGANIGAGVLLIGQVRIGTHACIGSASTILDSDVAPGQIIPPGTLLGDRSRPAPASEAGSVTDAVALPVEAPQPGAEVPPDAALTGEPATAETQEQPDPGVNVYGQVYVNQLLVKLFPHKQQQVRPEPE